MLNKLKNKISIIFVLSRFFVYICNVIKNNKVMLNKNEVLSVIKEYVIFNIEHKYSFNKRGYFWHTPAAFYRSIKHIAKLYNVHYLTAFASEAYFVLKCQYVDMNEMEKILYTNK